MRKYLIWLTIFVLSLSSLSYGQVKSSLESLIQLTEPKDDHSGTVSSALEYAIDPKEYLLGPGDKLEFVVWGILEVHQMTTVGPDGSISIPNIGEFNVAYRSLHEIDSLVAVTARAVYPKSTIRLRIVGIRQLKVSISGAVVNPGVYAISALDRLSNLIHLAGGFIDEKLDELEARTDPSAQDANKPPSIIQRESWSLGNQKIEYRASQRRILVRNKDHSEHSIDYLKYVTNGTIEFNPVITDGQEVNVPLKLETHQNIFITGAVNKPGYYEVIAGDKVSDIIEVAGGFSQDAIKETVELHRLNESAESKVTVHNINFDNFTGNDNPIVRPADRIIVRSNQYARNEGFVKVTGEVSRPGLYQIVNGQTKLSEVLLRCGGIENSADLYHGKLIRWSSYAAYDAEFAKLYNREFRDIGKAELSYIKFRYRNDLPNVIIDFNKLIEKKDPAYDVVLVDGDEIILPSIKSTVEIIGGVLNPGLVSYEPGKNYKYYIKQAGGFSLNADDDEVRLLKGLSKKWIELDSDTIVEIGDTIFVPEKKEIDYWQLFKDVLLVVSQITTLILVVKTL